MKCENRPYYCSLRVASQKVSFDAASLLDSPFNANVAHHLHCQSIMAAIFHHSCHSLSHLSNVSISFGNLDSVTPNTSCAKFLTSIGPLTHLVVAIFYQQFCLKIFLSTSSLLVINTRQVALCFKNSWLALIYSAEGMTCCIISMCQATPCRFMAPWSILYILRTATPHPLFGRCNLPLLPNFVPCATSNC